jgi:putative membrane protein insertion efficiency factor
MQMFNNLLSAPYIFLIKLYQKVLSPMKAQSCRLHPSCSNYAATAFKTHGPVKGFLLLVWRVLRCNPFTHGGVDPVPSKGHWTPDIKLDGTPRQLKTPITATKVSI